MHTPRALYYLLISLVTQFVLAIAALTVILLADLLGQLPWNMIGFLLAYNIAIATLVSILLTTWCQENKRAMLKGNGLVLGHLVGLILGGFIGLESGGVLWAIGAAAVLYFVFGWIGSRVSLLVGAYLDREATPAAPHDLETALRRAHPNTSSLFLYGAIIPAMLMAAAVLLRSSGLPFSRYPNILPPARTVLVVLSIISILVPWLRPAQRAFRRGNRFSRHTTLWLLGLGLSLAPAFYGFLLFVAFDTSLAELSLFAVVGSMAATAWGASRASR